MTDKRPPLGRGKQRRSEAPTVRLAPVPPARAHADAIAAAVKNARVQFVRELLAVAEDSPGGDVRSFLRGWLESWEQAEREEKERGR